MDAASHKASLHRLPLWAAVFVAMVCAVFLASAGWSEWSARAVEIGAAAVELGNLARSLTQHADDTVELAQSNITGIVAWLETDGSGRSEIEGLKAVLRIRKATLGRIRGIFVYDE